MAAGSTIPNADGVVSEVSLKLPNVSKFLKICDNSFQSDLRRKRPGLSALFEAVSNGNVRDLLHYVKEFMTSKHLDTRKILEKPLDYRIPDHEALRALLYKDFLHFDPSISLIVNLFDVSRADPAEHFSRMLVLDYLNRINSSSANYGFCDVLQLRNHLNHMGFSSEHTEETLKFLHEKKCFEGRVHGVKWGSDVHQIRITSLGRYHVIDLLYRFQYIDAMVVDTPVIDQNARLAIGDVHPIHDRLGRAQIFLDYLTKNISAVRDLSATRLWNSVYHRVTKEIAGIKTRLENENGGYFTNIPMGRQVQPPTVIDVDD